jgi:hypothetical protein
MCLPQYIKSNFPGLVLGPALFYNWPTGIRFELNIADKRERGFGEVVNRANTIYHEVFQPHDDCLVASLRELMCAVNPTRSHAPTSLFEFCQGQYADFASEIKRISIETEDGAATLEWGRLMSSTIDFCPIFAAIANAEFNKIPKITDRVYFVNLNRSIILHMYDDRGLDVIAKETASLLPLYNLHLSWILAHDRPQIDAIFECPII